MTFLVMLLIMLLAVAGGFILWTVIVAGDKPVPKPNPKSEREIFEWYGGDGKLTTASVLDNAHVIQVPPGTYWIATDGSFYDEACNRLEIK